jgi:hypothetical protein
LQFSVPDGQAKNGVGASANQRNFLQFLFFQSPD